MAKVMAIGAVREKVRAKPRCIGRLRNTMMERSDHQ